jgi:hypothetical protein
MPLEQAVPQIRDPWLRLGGAYFGNAPLLECYPSCKDLACLGCVDPTCFVESNFPSSPRTKREITH